MPPVLGAQGPKQRPPKQIMGVTTKHLATMATGETIGVLAPASGHDSFRLSRRSKQWKAVTPAEWQTGRAVEAFNLWGRFVYEVGDTLQLNTLDGSPSRLAEIKAIRMVDRGTLTDDDLKLLHIASRTEAPEQGWMIVAELLPGEVQANFQITHRVDIQDQDGTKTYNINLDRDAEN